MIVEVLSTGTEFLRGRNVDTNAAWLAQECGKAGLEVRHHQAIDDDFGRLVDAVKLAASRSDVVLVTGGLGPTEDDYTRRVAEEAFHRPLRFRPEAWRAIQARFRKYRIPMAPINRRQAYAPEGATLLPNPNGSAPGFALRASGVFFAAMPGPPRELYPMFLARVLPKIRVRRDVDVWEGKSFGRPEGHVDEIVLRAVKDPRAYGLTVKGGQVSIWIRAEGPRRKKILKRLSSRVIAGLGDGYYPEELADHVAKRLAETGKTLAAAESCTGGLITHKLTEVPGVSSVLLESIVTYSNASKVKRLGVAAGLIEKHGAVSGEVARAMAIGVARTSGASIGVAVTGIAGPSGGSKEKPVGLCYLAVDDWVERRVFSGERSHVKERAAAFALNMVRLKLLRETGNAGKKMGLRPRR